MSERVIYIDTVRIGSIRKRSCVGRMFGAKAGTVQIFGPGQLWIGVANVGSDM